MNQITGMSRYMQTGCPTGFDAKGAGRFFVVNPEALNGLVVELALYTHWPRSELLAIEAAELIEALPIAQRLSAPP